MNLKKGDQVICTNAIGNPRVMRGERYVIAESFEGRDGGAIRLEGHGVERFFEWRFEKINR